MSFEAAVERRSSKRASRRRRARARAARAVARRQVALVGRGTRLQRQASAPTTTSPTREPGERQQPGDQVEPLARRHGEHGGAELVDELRLDLALRVAGGDPRADERLHPQRDRARRRCRASSRRPGQTSSDSSSAAVGCSRSPPPAPTSASATQRDARGALTRAPSARSIPSSTSCASSTGPAIRWRTLPLASMKYVSGIAGDAVAADRRALAVVDVRVRDAVALEERARVAAEVLHVDADEDDVLALPALRRLLQQRRLVLARPAPGGPEVEHDRLAAQRGERQLAACRRAARA